MKTVSLRQHLSQRVGSNHWKRAVVMCRPGGRWTVRLCCAAAADAACVCSCQCFPSTVNEVRSRGYLQDDNSVLHLAAEEQLACQKLQKSRPEIYPPFRLTPPCLSSFHSDSFRLSAVDNTRVRQADDCQQLEGTMEVHHRSEKPQRGGMFDTGQQTMIRLHWLVSDYLINKKEK